MADVKEGKSRVGSRKGTGALDAITHGGREGSQEFFACPTGDEVSAADSASTGELGEGQQAKWGMG